MFRNLRNKVILALIVISFSLSACDVTPVIPYPQEAGLLLATQPLSTAPCTACAQETLAFSLTQQKNIIDNQAATTAEVMRANAQETFDSANATLGVAQTQAQNSANIVAAQIAATSEVARANA